MSNYDEESGAEILTIEEFMNWCKSGFINDYDGSGYYGTEVEDLDIPVFCSDANLDYKYTHVWWYNK